MRIGPAYTPYLGGHPEPPVKLSAGDLSREAHPVQPQESLQKGASLRDLPINFGVQLQLMRAGVRFPAEPSPESTDPDPLTVKKVELGPSMDYTQRPASPIQEQPEEWLIPKFR